MFLSLQWLYWSSRPKFVLPIKSMSVLLVGAETYIYIIPSFTLGAGPWYGACDTSGQAAMEMHGSYWWWKGWYKDASKPCFTSWLHDGCKTWECWDNANQRGSLGKSFSPARHRDPIERCKGMHQQKLSRGAAAGKGAHQPAPAMAAPHAGLGSTARGEGGQPACEGWGSHCLSPSPQLCVETEGHEWAFLSWPERQLPTTERDALAGEGEPSCLLGSQHLLHSCCGSGGCWPLCSRLPCSVGGRGRFRLQAVLNVRPLAWWDMGERVVASPGETLETPCRQRCWVGARVSLLWLLLFLCTLAPVLTAAYVNPYSFL